MNFSSTGGRSRSMAQMRDSSILASALWMVGISLLLFFVPAINGLVGGAVGGYKVGSVGRALAAAVLPAAIVGASMWVLFAVFGAPILGFLGGVAVGIWALISSVGLLLGAVVGGLLAPDRGQHQTDTFASASSK
jgi:hypothetical protein